MHRSTEPRASPLGLVLLAVFLAPAPSRAEDTNRLDRAPKQSGDATPELNRDATSDAGRDATADPRYDLASRQTRNITPDPTSSSRKLLPSDVTGPLRLRGDGALFGLLAYPSGNGNGPGGAGFGINGGLGLGAIPFTLGVDFMAVFQDQSRSAIDVPVGGQTFVLNREREGRTLFFDLWLRLEWPFWIVRPYLEGSVGAAVLQTTDSLSFSGTGTTTSSTSDHAWVSNLGWGVGVDFWRLLDSDGSGSLTLGFRRSRGGTASYDRVERVGNRDETTRYETDTSMTIIFLGFGASSGGSDVKSREIER